MTDWKAIAAFLAEHMEQHDTGGCVGGKDGCPRLPGSAGG